MAIYSLYHTAERQQQNPNNNYYREIVITAMRYPIVKLSVISPTVKPRLAATKIV